jgi:sugar lactone lactonase YvrE
VTRRAPCAAALALALAAPATAGAVPMCKDAHPTRDIVSGGATMESIVSDSKGRLVYSEAETLMRLDRPGSRPKKVAAFPKPGGLLAEPDGTLIAGSGDGLQEGFQGNFSPVAKLVRVNTDTGKITPYADGLQMSNGVARGTDGTIYASNDLGLAGIDRVKGGKVELGWGKVFSTNGMAVDPFGPYLYAAQTFQPAAIAKVDMKDPGTVTTHFAAPADEIAGGPDGMTIDERDRLFVAVNAAGEIWRVDPDGTSCTIATGITNASAVALGAGATHRSLFTVGFDGAIREIPDVRPAPPPAAAPVRLRVRPRTVRAGRRVRFRIRVTQGGVARSGAVVRFGKRRARTNAKGRAVIRRRLRRGRHVVRVGRGASGARAVVRARNRR